MSELVDAHGRRITYLRISVTERCNLSCFYCTPGAESCNRSGEEVLSISELLCIAKVAAGYGISKIRLTGGEPLLRPDLVELVRRLSQVPGINDLSLTTNGMLLDKLAQPLAQAGLQRLNISLDSLVPGNFNSITRGGTLERVLQGVRVARRSGLTPIKMNVVLLKGINDGEIADFARLTLAEDYHVRFIEYMPMTGDGDSWREHYLPLEAAMAICSRLGKLFKVPGPLNGGPARYFRLEGGRGNIGFISPLSRHFCGECNRLRITAQGKLLACLFREHEIDLRPLLKAPAAIAEAFARALAAKPDPASLAEDPLTRCRPGVPGMVAIGG
ncbi:MAG: GTP 3',8-cyclase MoaA [Dethiobacter sp.]|nr:GTP 3',8-cyclase MoaA [Dethiobacter sp.]